MTRIPRHIAIIMDGNGRWATARGEERSFGHQAGVETVRKITSECVRLGVKYLTLYTFSIENWNRPQAEVTALMSLLVDSLSEDLFMKNNVRMRIIGDKTRLPEKVNKVGTHLEERTRYNDAMTVVIALSYSSKWEIAHAAKMIAQEVSKGELQPEDITEELFNNHMQTAFAPDPDLLIRTGGELRISNYLLWQIAYSELYFCDTFWPDFDEQCLHQAIADYQKRQRRFGKTEAQVEAEQEADKK